MVLLVACNLPKTRFYIFKLSTSSSHSHPLARTTSRRLIFSLRGPIYLSYQLSIGPCRSLSTCTSRYPLVFGSWRGKLDSEHTHLPSVSQSMLGMIARSSDQCFEKTSRQLLSERLVSVDSRVAHRLVEYTHTSNPTEDALEETEPELSYEEILTSSIARLLKLSIRPSPVKSGCLQFTQTSQRCRDELRIHSDFVPISQNSKTPLPADVLCWDDAHAPRLHLVRHSRFPKRVYRNHRWRRLHTRKSP
ncbi:hypothetical protein BDW22DRAFT_903784 [Trametopsis cervina]|nr:hypothetical protein BDW22DRAFT_903784 [Trametopsis cervina]